MLCDVRSVKDLCGVAGRKSTEADGVLRVIAPHGKGLCSVFQLKWLLQCYEECDDEAVILAAAGELVKGREVGEEGGWMTAYDFCRRSGDDKIVECAWELEENGKELARSFVGDGGDKDKLKDAGFGKMAEEVAAALDGDEKSAQWIKAKWATVDFLYAKREFVKRYRDVRGGLEFARKITCGNGGGKFGFGEVEAYLDGHKDGEEALAGVEEGLVGKKRQEKEKVEPAKEVTGWVVDWLKAGGMDDYRDKFVEQCIMSEEDLVGISDGELVRCVPKFVSPPSPAPPLIPPRSPYFMLATGFSKSRRWASARSCSG